MIKITEEMKSAKKKRMDEVEARVDACILRAVESGRNICFFDCDKDADADVYDEIAARYRSAGYKIIPTGVIAGVMQLTENICW